MKKMLKRCFLVLIFLSLMLPIFLAVNSSARRSLYFLGTKVIPKSFFITNVKRNLTHRDFQGANIWLERYLKIVASFSKGNNTLLPGLIETTSFVMERARFKGEAESLEPFLKKLVLNWPELVDGRLWLAKAQANIKPKEALKNLHYAKRLSGADERIFREAINISLKKDFKKEVKNWCRDYKRSQFGGPHFFHYETIFEGTGLRDLALEILNEKGQSQVIPNSGLQLNEIREYNFSTEKIFSIQNLKLHLGIVSGVKITLKEIQFLEAGLLKKVLKGKEVKLSTSHGFVVAPNVIFSVNKNPETIMIFNKEAVKSDKIVMKILFERLPLSNASPCLNNFFVCFKERVERHTFPFGPLYH